MHIKPVCVTRHNRADSSLHLMLFLCYTLCLIVCCVIFNSVWLHIFDGSLRMLELPVCSEIISASTYYE